MDTRLIHRAMSGIALASLALLGMAVASPPVASAQRLRAQIYLVQAHIPGGLSEQQLLRFARSHQTTRMTETDEANLEERKWRAELVVNFSRPPDDLEFHVLYYDTQDGPRRFVDDMTIYVGDRSQRTYVQRITLARPRFAPNRRMQLVVTVRHEETGRKDFQMLGEERHRTGEVSFSDEEADPGAGQRQQQETSGGEQPQQDEAPPEEQPVEDPPPDEGYGPPPDDIPPESRSEPRGGGCGCGVADPVGGAWPVAGVLLLLGFRRRR